MLRLCITALLAALSLTPACFADAKLQITDQGPAGLSKNLAVAVETKGYQVQGDDGVICTVWLAKQVAASPDFKPTLNVKYPFQSGELIGVLQVHQASGFTDFRGQEIVAGTYTLRYGKQPVDGNHIGTSELYDFLLAIPAQDDTDPAELKSAETLIMKSTKTTGSNHPAIFSLLPADANDKEPKLVHEESKELWILAAPIKSTTGKSIPLRVVVVGVSEG